MDRVKDKVAVVTGGAGGIGHAATELLAREGATVALTDILEEEGRNAALDIRKGGGKAGFWKLNVASEAQVETVFTDIEERYGGIDILVNSAGIAGANKPTDVLTEQEWDEFMAVNVKGVFFCTKHAIAPMKKRAGGSIINICSLHGIIGGMISGVLGGGIGGAGDVPAGHASKGAVRSMTKNDALYYAPVGIRVNSILPGFIQTGMVEDFLKESGKAKDLRKQLNDLIPLSHMGEPEDVGWAVVYLASQESKFVTGSELVIDGGYTAR